MTCSAMSSMPCARRTLRAYKICAHEPMTVRTCSDTHNPLVTVTPRIFTVQTRAMPGIGSGGWALVFRRLSMKMISAYFVGLILRLLASAHASTLASYVCRLPALSAGMTMYVSSANLISWLSGTTGLRSAALTMYVAGPMPEP